MNAPRVAWMGDDDVTEATAAALGVPRLPVGDWRGLRRGRVEVVHLRGDVRELKAGALAATLGGALAVVATPTCTPVALPWWERRFQRYVFRSQVEAKEWLSAGIVLGRMVVVEPGDPAVEAEALGAVYAEVASMGRRPPWVTGARS